MATEATRRVQFAQGQVGEAAAALTGKIVVDKVHVDLKGRTIRVDVRWTLGNHSRMAYGISRANPIDAFDVEAGTKLATERAVLAIILGKKCVRHKKPRNGKVKPAAPVVEAILVQEPVEPATATPTTDITIS